jgi:NAD(P)-dependent dehydrogenase (short-subunit alcohol dehydrogenase family)
MTGRLVGKTCLVTGAAQGIGRSATEAFLREGARVIATDLQGDKLSVFDGVVGAVTRRLDVTDAAAVDAIAAEFPEVTVLLNCAGLVATGSVATCAIGDLERSFQVNVVSMANTIRAFLPGMRQAKNGSIINIASVVSSVMPAPDRFAYGTTKAAVIGLTLSVARDFIGEGVRCNAISPGTTETPSLAERMSQSGDLEAARAQFLSRQPMGRMGSPTEIAEVAILLASDEARFMTGANIIIDGGMSL